MQTKSFQRGVAVATVAVAVVGLLTGCFSTGKGHDADASRSRSATAGPFDSGSATASPSDPASGSASASPSAGAGQPGSPGSSPAVADPAQSRPATPEPVATPVAAPTLTPVPQGTVVAQADVASPKGSIHFHYRIVANGNNTYSVQYSDFTSTLPVPVSVTLLSIAPSVGDGLTYLGVGDDRLGGPTTAATSSTASLGSIGRPSYLGALVTYSSATTTSGIPTEIGPDKVLAVNTVGWSIPVRQTNVHPVDHGTRSYAAGVVTDKTASGAPAAYRVASGDTTAMVASRFGISIQDLIWLNANLEVFGDQQYLYAGTTINLDPDAL